MENNQFFAFEENNSDFPFYRDNNFLTKKSGIVMLLSVLLFIFLIVGPIKFLENQEELILFFVTVLPLLYITQGKLGYMFKRPKSDDWLLIVLCIFGSFFILFVLAVITTLTGTAGMFARTSFQTQDLTILSIILQFVQIIGEELLRAFIFLITLHLTYKYTNNRKLSIIVGIIIALLSFGLLHVNSYDNMLYNIVYMGFATFFELYPYIKTKNIVISIMVHFLFNMLVLVIQAL
jgi:membrane protease YdiL (CAAX protease family)